jgi:NAD(P)-dependent dehydrogenase (short-subunit alcohol dehydrogenase family)
MHPEDHSHARRRWAACLREHEPGEAHFRLVGASGIYRWFLTRAEPLRARDGRLLHWIGVNIDIDDEKRTRDALHVAKERIARATQIATAAELSASIAHEIVQPVSASIANARASLNLLSGEQPNIVQAKSVIERVLRDGMSVGNIVGLLTVPPIPAYAASKHAVQSIAEAMYEELKPFGIQVQTINPGPYLTGFNETVVEAGLRWLSDDVNFIKREAFQKVVDGLLGKPEGRLDPKDMIARMVEVIPSREGKFLNIFPPSSEEWVKSYQQQLYDRTI